MKIQAILFFLTLVIFQSCKLATTRFQKDLSIDSASRQEMEALNDKLYKAIIHNDLEGVKSMLPPELLEKFSNDITTLTNQISGLDIEKYSVLDEYSVQSSATGTNIYLPSGHVNNNDYTFTFTARNKESYVSLLLLHNVGNEFLLTAVYGKYQNGWKINILKFGQYSFFGNTAADYLQLARTSYQKSYLIDAVNNISLSAVSMQPAGDFFQFVKEKEIKEFRDSLLKEATAKYLFPMTLTTIDSKPKIFRIFPQAIKEGFFPMVYYLSDINLKDTVALKMENEQMRKKVDSIFTGIHKDKKFVFYYAFNEMPQAQKVVDHYGFIDSLAVK